MIQFNKINNMIEPFTILLSNRAQEILGRINNLTGINYKGNLNGADELSFEVHKMADGYEEALWDEIYDLRLVYVQELDEYFEINVSFTDQSYLTKTITATSLCEAELSQTMLYDIEINTETDIEAHDEGWLGSPFWVNSEDTSDTILSRVLEKVPAYKIKHVDSSLCNLQRVFTINGTSVYDWLVGDCAKEFNCLFKFDSTDRTISVYDLYTTCPACHSRGFYNDVCTHILTRSDIEKYGINGMVNGHQIGETCGYNKLNYYGTDTTILVSTENLTDEIKYETDIGAVKNSFRLVAGDDDMTAAIININPNGSQYIYNYSPETLKDMPEVLTDGIAAYNQMYDYYKYRKKYDITNNNDYNKLVQNYNAKNFYPAAHDGEKLSEIPDEITGYSDIMKFLYETMDFYSYLESSMMKTVIVDENGGLHKITAETEADKISANLSGAVSLTSLSTTTTTATVDNAILNLAKIYIKTGFVKIEISSADSVYNRDSEGKIIQWQGKIKVTNYSDEEDVAYSDLCTLSVNDNYENFMKQKIQKKISADLEGEDFTYDIFNISSLDQFKEQLKFYSLNRLASFKDALEAALGILQEANIGIDPNDYCLNCGYKGIIPSTRSTCPRCLSNQIKRTSQKDTTKRELYGTFYQPYYNKFKACEDEYNKRASELDVIAHYSNDYLSSGMMYQLMMLRNNAHEDLNFEKYLHDYGKDQGLSYDLYELLTTYTRQDEYNNSNYISTGLSNDLLFKRANEFYEAAEEELVKSSTYQHSLTANLYNLLVLDEFAPITQYFELGNWIRVKTDDVVYRLRLISYSVNFDDPSTLNTEFSDVTATALGYNDIQSLLKQAGGMATSFPAVTKQAELGKLANTSIDEWVKRGLDSAKTRIMNNNTEEIEISNVGITATTFNDITGEYDKEQLRVTHNVLAFTDDNWETVKTALGKFTFTHHLPYSSNTAEQVYEEYGLVANAVLAGWVVGSYFEAGDIIASHLQNVGHTTYIDLDDHSEFPFFINVKNGNFTVDYDGNMYSKGGHIESNRENGYPSYIDLNENSNYPNWIELNSINDNGVRTLFTVSKKDASITSSGGHFGNVGDTNYIDLGESDNGFDFLRCDGVFSVDKSGYLISTLGQIGGFYIGENFLATSITDDWNINHGEDDITIGSSSFTTEINTVRYNDTDNIVEPYVAYNANYRFAIGSYFGVTTDGEYFCLENRAGKIVTQEFQSNIGRFYNKLEVFDSVNSHESDDYTAIIGGDIRTKWIHSEYLNKTNVNPLIFGNTGHYVTVQKSTFHDNGIVETYFENGGNSSQFLLPWMTYTHNTTPPTYLPTSCIYLIYEDEVSNTTNESSGGSSSSGDITQDLFPSV